MKALGDPTRSEIQSVDRAMRILLLLAERGALGVGDIAVALGVHKSTASRLLAEMQRYRIVERSGPRGAFSLGPALTELAELRGASAPASSQAVPRDATNTVVRREYLPDSLTTRQIV